MAKRPIRICRDCGIGPLAAYRQLCDACKREKLLADRDKYRPALLARQRIKRKQIAAAIPLKNCRMCLQNEVPKRFIFCAQCAKIRAAKSRKKDTQGNQRRRLAWIRNNPQSHAESKKKWEQNNKAKIAAKQRAYCAKTNYRSVKDWLKRNPDYVKAKNARRRFKMRNGVGVSTQQWLDLVKRFGGKCFYCWENKPLCMDHKTPVSKGGRHEIGNIVPACRVCNSKKHSTYFQEYVFKIGLAA